MIRTKNNKSYLNGLIEGKRWEKKLIEAGLVKNRTGSLTFPSDINNPKKFVEDLIGAANIKKYVGEISVVSDKSESREVSKNNKQKVYKDNILRVRTDRKNNDLVITGVDKNDKALHKYIKDFGGKGSFIDKDKKVYAWIVPNNDKQLKQNEFYKALKSVKSANKNNKLENLEDKSESRDEIDIFLDKFSDGVLSKDEAREAIDDLIESNVKKQEVHSSLGL